MTIVMPTNAMTMRVAPMIVRFFFLLLNILYQFFVLLAKFLNLQNEGKYCIFFFWSCLVIVTYIIRCTHEQSAR